MSILKIARMGHPVLRASAEPVANPADPEIARLIEDMVETMQGGGFLIHFFVLTGGRIEVALRVGTTQTFNPKSVHKISEDEISTVQNK